MHISQEAHDALSRSKIVGGDILVTITGYIGQACIFPNEIGEANINQHIARIRVDGYDNAKYITFFLNSDQQQREYQLIQTGQAYPQLSLKQIQDTLVPFPPFGELKKIATILSSVDDVIEKTQAQIDKLKDLKTGMMQELLTKGIGHTEFKDSPVGRIPVGWDIGLFSDLFEFKNGVNKGKEYFGSGVPIISYRNVYDRDGIVDNKISGSVEMNENELAKFHAKFGDVFITRTSETPDEIGYANVYLGDRKDVVFSGFVIRARHTTKLFDPVYCLFAFQSHSVRQQMIHNSKFTTRAGISGESLSKLKIAIPPIEEQKKISNSLSSVISKIDSLISKNKSLKLVKKSLMQDLLTGTVRVNVDNQHKEEVVA